VFILFHLCTGLLLGVIMAGTTRDRRTILLATLGAVLPDLVDKPIGYIVFAGLFDSGRLFFHTLVLVAVLMAIGIALWYYHDFTGVVAVAAGIGVHQFFDAMWNMPSTWFWPLLGPFHPGQIDDFFTYVFWGEIFSPTEWLALIGIAGILLVIGRSERLQRPAFAAVAVVLVLFSAYLAVRGFIEGRQTVLHLEYPVDALAFALAGCTGAVLLAWRCLWSDQR
jgi:hypothetical protein